MKNYLEARKDERGFTLMEMLIVVAIIAILIAIAIPVFTGQLEKAREATDAANIRSAYAEVMMLALEDDASTEAAAGKTVALVQTREDWQTNGIGDSLKKLVGDDSYYTGKPKSKGNAKVAWVQGNATATGHATISFS